MKVSASKAAKMANVSIPTITRAIKDGRLSAEKQQPNGYKIDVAELERVFPLITNDPNVKPSVLENETPSAISTLEREIEMLREMMESKDSTIEDLRTRLDREGEERRAIQARLTDMTGSDANRAPLTRLGWFDRLLGRKSA